MCVLFPIELKEAFMLFDYMKTGRIYSEDLGAVVRSVGLKPSEAQIKAIQRDLDKGEATVVLIMFLSVVTYSPGTLVQVQDRVREIHGSIITIGPHPHVQESS